MTAAVVIGLGNAFRRDDGVGPAVAAAVDELQLPGVRVVCAADMTAILDAWDGVALAVVVDAAAGGPPGRVTQCAPDDVEGHSLASSHELTLPHTYELARALGRAPRRIAVVSIDVADTGYGQGLSPAVAQAVRYATALVVAELTRETDR